MWGLDEKTLQTIYKAVVVPIMLYCAAGWFERANKKHINMLGSAQRNMVLRMIKGYRTVSKEAAVVLAGTIPIDILMKEWSEYYHRRSSLIDKRSLRAEIREKSLEAWQERWRLADAGRHTYQYITNVNQVLRVTNTHLGGVLTQFLTGHGKFREYLKRVGITDSGECPKCGVDETSTHIIFEFPVYNVTRKTTLMGIISMTNDA